jgi:hypothetical protein
MMNTSDVTVPGVYLFYDAIGAPPVRVQVIFDEERGFFVRFPTKPGRPGADLQLPQLRGQFEGPLPGAG